MKRLWTYLCFLTLFLAACQKDKPCDQPTEKGYDPTPYILKLPPHFNLIGAPYTPEDNPMTEEGVSLGKKLFYEKRLSVNNQLSCAGCHRPEDSFSDKGNTVSLGAKGSPGKRNAPALFNLGWVQKQGSSFTWIGSRKSIERQAMMPITTSFEMDSNWDTLLNKLQSDAFYPDLFFKAFGKKTIDTSMVVKAIAQFERTLISGNSKYDNFIKIFNSQPIDGPALNAQERRGFDLYMAEGKGDCFHCHGGPDNPLVTDNQFRNNGLDINPDSGLAEFTKNSNDLGKFKTPSLRNLVYSAPYMHDGRFQTLEEVVDFYADDVKSNSTNLDPLMRGIHRIRNLSPPERKDLIAFLKAITDSSFVNDPAHLP